MPGGQGLDAGDAGDHLEFEGAAARIEDRLQDAHGTVVQRRIAPHQKTTPLTVGQFFIDQAFEGGLFSAVQRFDAVLVVQVAALAFRAAGFDETVGAINDVAPTDFAPQVQQFVLGRALVHEKDHLQAVQGFHCLHRQVIRIAGPNADD